MVDSSVVCPSKPDTVTGDLVFRVCGSSRDGQIVRLKSDKCTIGSASRCTLRLRARGIQPLHCLILRGTGGTVVRRWATDTRLNGYAFTDADLSAGDRLSVGRVELEVVEPGHCRTAQPSRPAADQEQRLKKQRLDEKSTQLDARAAELARQQQQFEQRQQHWEAERIEAERWLDDRNEEIHSRQAELESRRNTLEEERRRWQAERESGDTQTAEQTRQADADNAELEQQRQELEQQRRQWEAERAEAEKQLAERSAEIDGSWAELESRRNALEEERHRWQAEREAGDTQTAEQTRQFDARMAKLERQREQLDEQAVRLVDLQEEFEARREEFEQQRREWEESVADERQRIDEADEPEPREVPETSQSSSGAPVDLNAVLQRMGSVDLLDGDEPEQTDLEQEPERTEAPPETEASVCSPSPGEAAQSSSLSPEKTEEEGEESIDDYMTRLMQRVRAIDGKPREAGESSAESPSPETADPDAMADTKPGEPAASAPDAPIDKPESVVARTVAPEKQVDLSAMRELANFSAQSAITRYNQKKMAITARGEMLTIVATVLAGVLTAWMSTAMEGTAAMTAFYSAMVIFVVSLLWIAQYTVATSRLKAARSDRPGWEADDAPSDDEDDDDDGLEAVDVSVVGEEPPQREDP